MAFSLRQKMPVITVNTGLADIARRMLERKDMTICLILLLALIALALLAPFIAPYDPNAIDLDNKNLGPAASHWLGTDYLGRDMLSRILLGARTSMFIASSVVAASLVVGITIGSVSAYYGGIVDDVVSRVIDIFMSFPGMIFALVMLGALGPGVVNMIISLAMVQWSTYARLMRGQTLAVKEKEYVQSAALIGSGDGHILRRHIIPNSIAPIIALATLDMGNVILSIAALSFLGIGLPASVPEWGSILNSGKEFMRVAPLITIVPGVTISIVVIIFSLLGDGLRDILDPHKGEAL